MKADKPIKETSCGETTYRAPREAEKMSDRCHHGNIHQPWNYCSSCLNEDYEHYSKNLRGAIRWPEDVKKIKDLEAKLAVAVEALEKCADQMNYYSCEIRDNPSSWNEVIDGANGALQKIKGGK